MKILIIEDEKDLLESIVSYLAGEGYLCEKAADYESASLKIWDYDYDIIVVDIMLPDGSGLGLLEEIREKPAQSGVIVISAKDSLDDKLAGLDLGADDYITKPFHLAELNSRLKALSRRMFRSGKKMISFNEIELDPEQRTTFINKKFTVLTKKEFDILAFFINNKNRVLTKESLAEHLWGDMMSSCDNYDFLYTHVRNLRKKISAAGGNDYIKTIYGLGYKFSDR